MKIPFVFFLLPALLLSCRKDYVSHTASYIKNTTTHTIRLLPYLNGHVETADAQVISSLATVKVYEDNVYGKTLEPCYGTLIALYDSIVVTFDDSIKIPHIKFNLPYGGGHAILFTSNRAISNKENWLQEIETTSKHTLSGKFTYLFTEQDFLDAK